MNIKDSHITHYHQPPVYKTEILSDPVFTFCTVGAGTCASLLVCGLLLFYLGRTCWCRPAPAAPLPKVLSLIFYYYYHYQLLLFQESVSLGAGSRGSVVEQQDLIHMADGLIVPVSRPRSVHWSGNMKTSWILFFCIRESTIGGAIFIFSPYF